MYQYTVAGSDKIYLILVTVSKIFQIPKTCFMCKQLQRIKRQTGNVSIYINTSICGQKNVLVIYVNGSTPYMYISIQTGSDACINDTD